MVIIENVIKLLEWCKIKIFLLERSPSIFFKEGELWWCRIGMNVGHEIYGKGDSFKRPILILKKLSAVSFFGIPLTSQVKVGSWYVPVAHDGKKRTVILSQARVFDARRLTDRIGVLSQNEFQRIKTGFIEFYSS